MKKKIIAVLVSFLVVVPSFAVLNEKDLSQTLSVLRYELRTTNIQMERYKGFVSRSTAMQHDQLVHLMERCNELSLMLYSQKQDYTFDLTYALDEVTREYRAYGQKRLPYDKILSSLDIEIERYKRLIHTLKCLPPALIDNPNDSLSLNYEQPSDSLLAIRDSLLQERRKVHEKLLADMAKVQMQAQKMDSVAQFVLDSTARADRDSCILYAQSLLDVFELSKSQILDDNYSYDDADQRLKEAYDYAQNRYRLVQKNIFVHGQTNYVRILKNFRQNFNLAMRDTKDKYSREYFGDVQSEWRGPMVIGLIGIVLFYLILAVILAAVLVKVAMKYIPYLRTGDFKAHKPVFLLLTGSVIFAVTVLIARAAADQHFFRMASVLLVDYALMLAAVFASLLIRLDSDQIRPGIMAYTPIIILAITVIFFRIIFIPNRLLNIVFPPLLAIFAIWQYLVWKKNKTRVPKADRFYMMASLVVITASCIVSCVGYVLIAIQFVIWWLFQLTFIQAITTIYYLIGLFKDKFMAKRMRAYRIKHSYLDFSVPGTTIEVSWFYDLVIMVVMPIAGVLSVPLSVYMAANVFDLSEVILKFIFYPFLNYEKIIHLSMSKIVVVLSMYYIFRYLIYVLKSAYRVWKTRREIGKTGQEKIQANQLNLTLSNNMISLFGWGLYIIIALGMLKIPTSALKTIGAGLAAGMGFAMKDILNNFFYGIQLMSGRLRVGDKVECDGVRGTVDSINYQSTQIISEEGSIMAFPNANLFNKNFKNLTKNHSYELLKLPFGVKYGTDVDMVRKLIVKALKTLQKKDVYGNDIVDPKFGVQVRFMDFGDNSVNLSVYQFVTVESKYSYASKAKEIIYNTLNSNGIEIPFPQRDVYVKTVPDSDRKV
ncbi:MAG: mechanosensitive ion channel [Bacteroidales bacterium]|nr:mechanosensitive ion channel [Bacteroidales bacterium]